MTRQTSSSRTTRIIIVAALVAFAFIVFFLTSTSYFDVDDGSASHRAHSAENRQAQPQQQNQQNQQFSIIDNDDVKSSASASASSSSSLAANSGDGDSLVAAVATTASASAVSTTAAAVTASTATATQVKKTSAFDIRDRITCADIDPVPADVSPRGLLLFDTFKLTRFHACEIHDVWIVGARGNSRESSGGLMVLFPPQLTEAQKRNLSNLEPYGHRKFSFPVTPFDTRFSLIVEAQDEHAERRQVKMSGNNAAVVHMSPGVTVIVPVHYCCTHIVHFMESLGALSATLDRWLEPSIFQRRSHVRCPTGESKQCFRTIDRVIVFSAGGVVENSFNWHMIRSLLFGALARAGYPVETAFDIPIGALRSSNTRFERIVAPGSLYDIWPSSQMAMQFRSDVAAYFFYRLKLGMTQTAPGTGHLAADREQQRQQHQMWEEQIPVSDLLRMNHGKATAKASHKNTSSNIIDDNHASDEDVPAALRRVVWFDRTGVTRGIVDKEQFHHFLKKCTRAVNATVDIVRAGLIPTDLLFRRVHGARVFIGMHGADFGNIVMAPQPSSIIEMNPFVFWEPRFHDMATKLGIKYFAWNCNTVHCAFGGQALQLRINLPTEVEMVDPEEDLAGGAEFNKNSKREDNGAILLKLKDERITNETARWPAIGYIPEQCGKPCNDIVHHTGLGWRFFSTYRGASVRIMAGKHPRQIATLLFESFLHAGWAKEPRRAEVIRECLADF